MRSLDSDADVVPSHCVNLFDILSFLANIKKNKKQLVTTQPKLAAVESVFNN
jgi:hypothetical protein